MMKKNQRSQVLVLTSYLTGRSTTHAPAYNNDVLLVVAECVDQVLKNKRRILIYLLC